MAIFPTQYSTLSSLALRDHIAHAYGLDKDNLTCRLLVRNVSDTYTLSDRHTRYIFKIYRDAHRKLDEIRGEVELLLQLGEHHIPVAAPIPDRTGNTVQQFQAAEGTRNGVLFQYARGKVVLQPDDGQLGIIGRELARMHNVTAACTLHHSRIVYDYHTTLDKPLQTITTRFADLPEEYGYLTDLATETISALNALNTDDFSYGYCHYDFLPKNFHFDEDNGVTIFDFDWVGRGYLVNDLMTFYVQYFFLLYHKAITREKADKDFNVFLQAYRQHRQISSDELAAIPHLGVMFWIYAFGFYEDNFDDFSNTFLTPKFIKDRVQIIKAWTEIDTSSWY